MTTMRNGTDLEAERVFHGVDTDRSICAWSETNHLGQLNPR
jgi:hypothetical protein